MILGDAESAETEGGGKRRLWKSLNQGPRRILGLQLFAKEGATVNPILLSQACEDAAGKSGGRGLRPLLAPAGNIRSPPGVNNHRKVCSPCREPPWPFVMVAISPRFQI